MTKATLTFDDILYFQRTVVEWNAYGGNSVDDKSLINIYKSLTQEELLGKGELLESWEKKDWVGICDGIVDSIYVAFFWAVLYDDGVTLYDKTWFETKGNMENMSEGELLEDMASELDLPLERSVAGTYATGLLGLLHKLSDKIDIRKAFDKVTESNYSKYPLVANVPDIDAEVKWIEQQGRYAQVFAETFDTDQGQRVVFKAMQDVQEGKVFDKAKIVKSRQYKEVVGLEECIYSRG